MLTPNDLEILIHCHVSPTLHPNINAPAVRETIDRFVKDGIIESSYEGGYYNTTEKGKAWLTIILQTPHPREAWVDNVGRVIKSR